VERDSRRKDLRREHRTALSRRNQQSSRPTIPPTRPTKQSAFYMPPVFRLRNETRGEVGTRNRARSRCHSTQFDSVRPSATAAVRYPSSLSGAMRTCSSSVLMGILFFGMLQLYDAVIA
jgi:hypothetical protein